MNQAFTKSRAKSGSVLLAQVLILAFTFGVVLNSCSPSVVRSNSSLAKKSKSKSNKSKTKKQKEIKELNFDDIAKFEPAEEDESKIETMPISQESNVDLIANNSFQSKRKLPTLREQIEALNSENTEIRNDVALLDKDVKNNKRDLTEVKDEIYDIQQTIAELKSKIDEYSKPKPQVYTGDKEPAQPAKQQPQKAVAKKQVNENVILSDEEEQQQKTVAKTKEIEKPKVENATKPANNQNSEPKANTDEIPEFRDAMSNFAAKDFRTTIQKLQEVEKQNDDLLVKSDCNYWIGESHYSLKEYDKAINSFLKVINTVRNHRQDDAQLMLAEANMKNGKVEDAKKAYQSLVANYPKSEFVPKARKMLQQL